MIDKTSLTDIFFDLDHTLWDFEANSAATFSSILAPFDYPFSVEEFLNVYSPINHAYWKRYRENEITTEELRFSRIEKTFEVLQVPIPSERVLLHSEKYIEELSTHTHLFEGTKTLLDALHQKYHLHIITNGFEQVQQKKMRNSGIEKYFQVVLTAEKAGVKKPKSEIFQKALQMAQTSAAKSLMVGDSLEADVQGALAVGMQAIHFNSHNENEHALCPIVSHLNEIKNYL